MIYTKKIILPIILIMSMILATMLVTANENITLNKYQSDNTYLIGEEKNINTTIAGDLFLITAKSNVQGTINDDLNAISSDIKIQGIIGDDLRVIAAKADVNAYVFSETKLIIDQLNIKNSTIIKGKTSIISNTANIDGTYNDDFEITSKEIILNGVFQGNVKIKGDKITINPNTTIHGNLEISKNTQVPQGVVLGDVTFIDRATPKQTTQELLIEKIALFLTIAILATILVLIAKNPTKHTINKMTMKPLKKILIGFLAIIIIPIISIMTLISIVIAPIGIITLLVMLILLILTPAIAAIMLGEQTINLMKNKHESRLGVLLGTAILIVLSFIPGFLGFILFWFYTLIIGTIIFAIFPKKNKKNTTKKKITKNNKETSKKSTKKNTKKNTKKT